MASDNNHDINKDETSKLCGFRKPYEPRNKKVILARASVPRIPKTDTHRISELNFKTRHQHKVCSPPKRKIIPVRKFASNGFGSSSDLGCKKVASPPVEAEKNMLIDESTATNTNTAITNGEKAVKKVVKSQHTIDMPTFALAGIVENKPRELEGWFTNKIFQLKKLSSELTQNTSTNVNNSNSYTYSHYNNHCGNNIGTVAGFEKINKLCQKNRDKAVDKNVKVKYSEGGYQIMDLEEYKVSLVDKKHLETESNKANEAFNNHENNKNKKFDELDDCIQDLHIVSLPFNTAKTNLLTTTTNILTNHGLRSLCSSTNFNPTPTTTATNSGNSTPGGNNSVSELLRVARRIEKISNQGIGRSKSYNLLRDVPFLPKGWMKVVKRKSFQSDKSPKITIRTCVEYVNGDGKTFDSLSSAIRFIAREQILKRQRNVSY